jgi:hypothetical protein
LRESRMEKIGSQAIYQKQWHKTLQIEVEVVSRGHFPTTAIVRLPDGKEIETDIIDMEPVLL